MSFRNFVKVALEQLDLIDKDRSTVWIGGGGKGRNLIPKRLQFIPHALSFADLSSTSPPLTLHASTVSNRLLIASRNSPLVYSRDSRAYRKELCIRRNK